MPQNLEAVSPRCAAALSTKADTAAAVAEVCRAALDQLAKPVDLAVVFFSQHHAEHAGVIAESLCRYLATENLMGCTGEAIVGGDREIEEGPAISLWLGHFPKTRVQPLRIEFQSTPDGGLFHGLPDLSEIASTDHPQSHRTLLLLAEPFSFPADALLERMQQDTPGLPVLGGMASGGQSPGTNLVLFGPKAYDRGAAAVLLEGAVRIRSVVSQGCQPIGKPFLVTKCDRNLLLELGRKPAFEQFQEVYKELPTSEQSLVQRGLHVGIAMNEYQDEFSRGDFLVRNVVGADPETGAIGIGDFVRVGQTVRFHLRDSKSADEDLRHLLADDQKTNSADVAGALLFTCNGRGTRMFDQPDHDAKVLQELLGNVPVAGFFAQGEIGPVAGRNHLHGFTASVAIVESKVP